MANVLRELVRITPNEETAQKAESPTVSVGRARRALAAMTLSSFHRRHAFDVDLVHQFRKVFSASTTFMMHLLPPRH